MATIIKIPINERDRYPKLILLYKKYNDITAEHCIGLIKDLYKGIKDDWINPLTKRSIKTTSDRFISFLSTCYYKWGDNRLEIDTPNWKIDLTYKEHITKFIPVEYLFEIPLFTQHPNLLPSGKRQPHPPVMRRSPLFYSPQEAATNAPRRSAYSTSSSSSGKRQPSPPVMPRSPSINSPQGAATNAPRRRPRSSSRTSIKSISPPRIRNIQLLPSPQGAVANAPRRSAYSTSSSTSSSSSGKRQPPPPVMPRSPRSNSPKRSKSPITKKLTFSMKSSDTIIAKTMLNANQLKESDCDKLLKEMKKKMRNKTDIEILDIMLTDPITTKEIGIDSPFIKSYLAKCYYGFDNKNIKKNIDKLVNIGDLDNFKNFADKKAREEEEELLKRVKEKEEFVKRRPDIEKFIAVRINTFNEVCDELIDKCKDGILPSHKYIADIVNAILAIIYTKYLHLYDNITPTTYDKPLHIYMYDEDFHKYYIDNGLNSQLFTHIIYQKDDLMKSLNETKIDLKPKTIERYKENTLFNRQYVFELSKKDKDTTIKYNMINSRKQDFNALELVATLEYAYNLLFYKDPFNYNITNSILPKIIKIECLTHSVLGHFDEILHTINTRLKTLPVIKDVRSTSDKRYNNVIVAMKECEFGDNDMIRKNILYSLNAQVPSYIKKYITLYSEATLGLKDFYKDKIYYNYGYTGTFPLFTWIPISSSGSDGTIYNFPSSSKWQPYGADKTEIFKQVDKAYKNYYTQPFSKSLNETIYKVISGESTDVDTRMTKRINETIGIYKDMDKAETYKNEKIYLYHGTNQKLHYMDGKKDDIELLGFLSTTLNIYTASFYSEVGLKGNGFIYIIEVDDTQTYINLNDNLYQILLLPHSIIRILHTFDYIGITIILCRLIETPTKEQSIELYNKLLAAAELTAAKVAVFYYIKRNNNAVPICAGFRGDDLFKKEQLLSWYIRGVKNTCNTKIKSEYMDIFQIPREWLAAIPILLPLDNRYELYVYFSLLQENELYLIKGEKTKGVYGGFDDIKYSIHQHFIKDCYKSLNIPCIDYAFLHGDENTKNAIATGILLDDYKANRKSQYKYDINNLLIDCIFNFDSIDNNNKKLDLPGVVNSSKVLFYADKIEGFRNAGLYINGIINPLFRFDSNEQLDYILEYVNKNKRFLYKYSEAIDTDLEKHFECCNKKFTKLVGIIDNLKEQYSNFINDILQANSVSNNSNKELEELKDMLNKLADTLKQRALFHISLTSDIRVEQKSDTQVVKFIKLIRKALSDEGDPANDILLPENSEFADLIILCEEDKKTKGGFRKTKVVGDYLNQIIPKDYINAKVKEQGMRKSSGTKREEKRRILIEETNNEINASISGYKSMYKFEDLPEDFQKYYGKKNKGKEVDVDISNSCHIRLVPRKD